MTPMQEEEGSSTHHCQIYRMTAHALLLVRRRHVSLCIENPYAACIICKTSSITVRGEDECNTPIDKPMIGQEYNKLGAIHIHT